MRRLRNLYVKLYDREATYVHDYGDHAYVFNADAVRNPHAHNMDKAYTCEPTWCHTRFLRATANCNLGANHMRACMRSETGILI